MLSWYGTSPGVVIVPSMIRGDGGRDDAVENQRCMGICGFLVVFKNCVTYHGDGVNTRVKPLLICTCLRLGTGV